MKELHFFSFDEIAYANVRVGDGITVPPKKQRLRIILKSGAVVTLEHPEAIKAVTELLRKKANSISEYTLGHMYRDKHWYIQTEEKD